RRRQQAVQLRLLDTDRARAAAKGPVRGVQAVVGPLPQSNTETRTMTEEKKIEDKKKQPNPLAELPRGIPVALLRLGRPIQVPGRQSDDTLKSEKQPSGRTWEIEYIPQIRHFKVTYSDPERQKEPKVGFVHESVVLSWEPAT